MPPLDYFGLTDAGKVRANNEDALLSGEGRDPSLFAVADGIGGFEAGEVASSMVVESLGSLEPGGSLQEAIQEANRRIHAAASRDEKLAGMGTTVVAVRLSGSGGGMEAEISHVGDSRLYLLRGGELRPLTEDHSLVAELVRSGSLTRAQASEHPQKNLITRALGAEEEVEVDSSRLRLQHGDRLVLCSDGLPDMVPEARISELISGDAGDAEETTRRLVSAALSAGGTDNVTVIVVDVDAPDSAANASESAAGTAQPEPTQTARTNGAESRRTPPAPGAGRTDTGGAEEAGETAPRGGRRSRGILPGGRRRRRPSSRGGSGRGAPRPEQESPPADSRESGGAQGSLIPGVWDGVREEEPEEPREPSPEEVVEQFRVRAPQVREEGDYHHRRRRKRAQRRKQAVSTLVRALAALVLIAVLLVPPYLWWNSRYFLDYDNEEIVVYQGVPYDFLGHDLYREERRTGIQRSDISEPYRDQIEDNRIYTEERLNTVLDDLQEA